MHYTNYFYITNVNTLEDMTYMTENKNTTNFVQMEIKYGNWHQRNNIFAEPTETQWRYKRLFQSYVSIIPVAKIKLLPFTMAICTYQQLSMCTINLMNEFSIIWHCLKLMLVHTFSADNLITLYYLHWKIWKYGCIW